MAGEPIERPRNRLRTAARLTVVVLGASAISVLVLSVVRACFDTSALAPSNGEVGNYLQAVGTVYAVLLAFVVYVVWGQHNDARVQVDQEANEVVDLYRTADGFPDDARQHIQAGLRTYVDEVLRDEWVAMADIREGSLRSRTSEATFERIGAHLDAIWDGLHCIQADTNGQQALHAEALSRFNELSDARTRRLTSARTHIPLGLKLLMYVGAFVLVASMYLISVESFAVHAVITAAMAGAVSHVLYVVIDLDDAFAGDWQVQPAAFHRVRRYMERRSQPGADACRVPAPRVAVGGDDNAA